MSVQRSNVYACAKVVMTGALRGCQIQVVSHEIPTTTQAPKLWYFKSIFF